MASISKVFVAFLLICLCRYDTMKAAIAVVSNVGCEALRDAEEKMSMVTAASLALWDTVRWL